jgi:hypothetical protein
MSTHEYSTSTGDSREVYVSTHTTYVQESQTKGIYERRDERVIFIPLGSVTIAIWQRQNHAVKQNDDKRSGLNSTEHSSSSSSSSSGFSSLNYTHKSRLSKGSLDRKSYGVLQPLLPARLASNKRQHLQRVKGFPQEEERNETQLKDLICFLKGSETLVTNTLLYDRRLQPSGIFFTAVTTEATAYQH